MDKLIMEKLQQINETMLEMYRNVQTLEDTMNQRFDAMDKRFDAVENKLEKVENRLDSIGAMIERKINTQGKDDNIMNTLRYLSHKVSEHDEEIFHLKNKK